MAKWMIHSLDGKSYSINAATADEAAAKALGQGVEAVEKPVRVSEEPETSGAEPAKRRIAEGELAAALVDLRRAVADLASRAPRESWHDDRKRVHKTVRNAVLGALVLFAAACLVLGAATYIVLAMNGLAQPLW